MHPYPPMTSRPALSRLAARNWGVPMPSCLPPRASFGRALTCSLPGTPLPFAARGRDLKKAGANKEVLPLGKATRAPLWLFGTAEKELM